MHPGKPRQRPKLIFLAPFLAIALLLTFMGAVVARRVAALRSATQDVVDDAMTDVLLMAQMRRDLDKVQLLASEHVYEKSASGMTDLDARIASTQADFDAAASEFESFPLLPEEQAPWQDTKRQMARISPALASVLALSRVNDDEPARRQLLGLDDTFAVIADDLRALSDLNTRNAKAVVPRVGSLELSAELHLAMLATIGVALALMVGVMVTRALQTREGLFRLYAERLETSNEELDAFAGRVAHDLRAPLTTATLTAAWLAGHSEGAEHQRRLHVLQRSFGRMDAIIQDLLALSRIVPVGSSVFCDPAAATELLRDDLASRADEARVGLTIDVQAAKVHCSEGLLRQVIWNLADNAMKYRRKDVPSRVQISGRACGQTYELAVRDNGIGISREEARMIFEPFFRADGGRSEPGTGLGLSIVKRAVEANGGGVSVTSEPGRGSAFVARLRLA